MIAALQSKLSELAPRVETALGAKLAGAVDRPELARAMGNHARFFAYLALLPLGVRRAMFLDVDTLAHDDVAPLMASPLDEQKFVAAAKRCAPKRAAYKPRF